MTAPTRTMDIAQIAAETLLWWITSVVIVYVVRAAAWNQVGSWWCKIRTNKTSITRGSVYMLYLLKNPWLWVPTLKMLLIAAYYKVRAKATAHPTDAQRTLPSESVNGDYKNPQLWQTIYVQSSKRTTQNTPTSDTSCAKMNAAPCCGKLTPDSKLITSYHDL